MFANLQETIAAANAAAPARAATPVAIEFSYKATAGAVAAAASSSSSSAGAGAEPGVIQLTANQQRWFTHVVHLTRCMLGNPDFRRITLAPLYASVARSAKVLLLLSPGELDDEIVGQLNRRIFEIDTPCAPDFMEVVVPAEAFDVDHDSLGVFSLHLNQTWLNVIERVFAEEGHTGADSSAGTAAAAAASFSASSSKSSAGGPHPAGQANPSLLRNLHTTLGVIKLTREIVHTLTPHMVHLANEAVQMEAQLTGQEPPVQGDPPGRDAMGKLWEEKLSGGRIVVGMDERGRIRKKKTFEFTRIDFWRGGGFVGRWLPQHLCNPGECGEKEPWWMPFADLRQAIDTEQFGLVTFGVVINIAIQPAEEPAEEPQEAGAAASSKRKRKLQGDHDSASADPIKKHKPDNLDDSADSADSADSDEFEAPPTDSDSDAELGPEWTQWTKWFDPDGREVWMPPLGDYDPEEGEEEFEEEKKADK